MPTRRSGRPSAAEPHARATSRLGLDAIAGESRGIARVRNQVRQVASTRTSVLMEGEPGTGKSLVARVIHDLSPHPDEPFVEVICGALAPDLLEGELFGLSTGKSPGDAGDPGRLERARAGTLFMDEVAAASPAVQLKLLRALQEGVFERLGGRETLKVHARLVAATERGLEAETRAGRFRQDLLDRLGAVRIAMPPLRQRLEDIPALVEHFIQASRRDRGRRVTGITRGALERLSRHPWPGNVGELKNAVENMVTHADRGRLDLADLPPWLGEPGNGTEALRIEVGMTVEEVERRLIEATLRYTGNDRRRAATLLGIGLRTLYRKIKQLRLG